MRAIHSIGGGSRLVTIKREKCCQILNVGMFQRMRTVAICVGALPVWAIPHAVVSISSAAHHLCVLRGRGIFQPCATKVPQCVPKTARSGWRLLLVAGNPDSAHRGGSHEVALRSSITRILSSSKQFAKGET